jgi:hypothetical protein
MGWSSCPIEEVPAEVLASQPPAPRKRTPARRKRDYERHLARWGSHAEAAARTGVDARTSRRWREDPAFAARCRMALKLYGEMIEMEAFRRVETPECKPVWYRGRQIGHLRRQNTTLLLRLLDRLSHQE